MFLLEEIWFLNLNDYNFLFFFRKTKKQLRSIDREGAGSFVDLKLYVDDMIYLTTSTSVYAIDVLSSKLQMSKILNVKG